MPLSVKVMPPGRLPLLFRAGAGYPLAETVNEPAVHFLFKVTGIENQPRQRAIDAESVAQ